DVTVKDPLITRSDDWDFVTNKFPGIGWLGRVHRGTPWQTVYLKAGASDTNKWQKWSGHVITNWDGYGITLFDSLLTHPTMDYHIFDLFTTAFNDNAARGQMSINQTNLAAWSAVLSGVIALTNSTSDADLAAESPFQFSPFVIDPAGIYDPKFPPPLV